jgi:hypothetical protein
MSNKEKRNPLTDALKLVQIDTVSSFWHIFRKTISFEDGFSLELFRGGIHLGSILSSQVRLPVQMMQRFEALNAKGGDTLYRINLGPRIQVVQGKVQTMDSYTREYEVSVELQVSNTSQFIELYRQGADPVNMVIRSIRSVIQEYADRTNHEDMYAVNIQAKAENAFDREVSNLRAGICINRAYEPLLKADPTIQQQIDLGRRNRVEITKMGKDAELADTQTTLEFESASKIAMQELSLLRMRQEKEKVQYRFQLQKDDEVSAHKLRRELLQRAIDSLAERASEDVQANLPLYQVIEDMTAALTSALPQIESGKAIDRQDSALNGQAGQDESQSSDGVVPSKRNKIKQSKSNADQEESPITE